MLNISNDGLEAALPLVLLELRLVLLVHGREQGDLVLRLAEDGEGGHENDEGRVDCQLLVGQLGETGEVVELAQAHGGKEPPGYFFVGVGGDLVVVLGVVGEGELALVEVEEGTAHNQFITKPSSPSLPLHGITQAPPPINLQPLLAAQYIRMSQETRSLTPFEKMWNAGFNIRYRVIGMIESLDKDNLVKAGDSVYLLGERMQIDKFNVEQQNALLFQRFANTPWLTYRAGFPQLYHDLKGTYVTDTGWGCMIRVGQMAFAEIIKSHRMIKRQEEMLEVVDLFNDFDKSKPFSIQNINKIARREYGILPGDWYNPSQISHVLSLLNQTYLESTLKLTFLVFNSGNLFFDQIVEAMMAGREVVRCDCKPKAKEVVCANCNQHKLSIGVIVLTRLGLYNPQEKYLKVLIEMMNLRHSKGMIGGRPGKALYFLGSFNGESMIYLDPHYVQQAKSETSQIQQSYFCGSFRTCKIKTIDPSIGICYYFRTLQDVNQFYRDLQAVRSNNPNEFFIWASENTPSYQSKSIRLTREIEIEEDQYQQL